jgi:iron complex outermembrane recepter protein
MNKYIAIPAWVLILLWPMLLLAAPADNTLTGRIVDNNQNPLAGVIISVPDLKAGTVSDNDGNYVLSHLPKGRYLIEVRLLGYGTATRSVNIDGLTQQDFSLNTSIIEKNEVVVTGTSLATEERKSVSPIESIRMKELRENPSSNIIDALAKQPGINQVSTGPAISKPVIRGLGYNRIITLNDGTRQEGQQWGDEHGIEIDDYNVSRIEILKGPASLAYGSDALAGVINIISDETLPDGKIEGGVVANYQTNNGMGALHGQLAGNQKGINWHVYGTGKQAHDYRNNYDDYVHNSRFGNANYGAGIGINRKWGYSRLSFSSFNQTLGIAEGDRDSATGKFLKLVNNNGEAEEEVVGSSDGTSYERQVPAQRIEHQKLVLANNFNLNNGGRIGLTLGYQQNVRKEYENPVLTNEPGLNLLLQTYTYDVKYYFSLHDGWSMSTGINGMAQNNTNNGDEYLVPDYKLFDAGMYIIAKKDWDNWSITGGIRVNHRNIDGAALYTDSTGEKAEAATKATLTRFPEFSRSYANVVGSAGASYTIDKNATIKFNIATGFRTPNIAELAANGVHEGTIRYEYGNIGLKPEKSVQADFGFNWNSDHVLVNAAVFYNYIHNFIFVQKLLNVTGNDSIPEANNEEGYPAFAYSQANAGLFGGEFYVDVHPHPLDWLHFENTFSYVRGVIFNGNDSTGNIPYIPAPRWLPELRAQKQNLSKWLKNGYIKAGLDVNMMQDKVFSAYGTETATDAYTLLNAGMGCDIVNRKQRTLFTLTIAAQNITDVTYQNHLSRLKYAPDNPVTGRAGIYNMGRNFSVMINMPLRIK